MRFIAVRLHVRLGFSSRGESEAIIIVYTYQVMIAVVWGEVVVE